MTVKVTFENGVFRPLDARQVEQLEQGRQFEIVVEGDRPASADAADEAGRRRREEVVAEVAEIRRHLPPITQEEIREAIEEGRL